jgi:hypothetical protein
MASEWSSELADGGHKWRESSGTTRECRECDTTAYGCSRNGESCGPMSRHFHHWEYAVKGRRWGHKLLLVPPPCEGGGMTVADIGPNLEGFRR